ncbi:MAG: class I SAM-dependent methyltransferase [Alphaproteobacteria bacterium]|nr:class I SAM-dependent methyltransferase [Alphaproteobacteria bacterium]
MSEKTKVFSLYKPYSDYETTLYECEDCGCRFCQYDMGIHTKLHSIESGYSVHNHYLEASFELFKENNTSGLKKHLSKSHKNKFIIDKILSLPTNIKIMETGCSKGYLTSYFIALGYDIIGTDISNDALNAAKSKFGDHFHRVDSQHVTDTAPYDVIYHVGTIGCVEKPIEFINYLLSLLKPGGRLLFNVPTLDFCNETGFPWALTPPPDLVTVFPNNFWDKQFSSVANIKIEHDYFSPARSFMWRYFTRFAYPNFGNDLLFNDENRGNESIFSKVIRKSCVIVSIFYSSLFKVKPVHNSVGIFVEMQKH